MPAEGDLVQGFQNCIVPAEVDCLPDVASCHELHHRPCKAGSSDSSGRHAAGFPV